MTLARKLLFALGIVTICWAVILVTWGPAPFAFSFDDAYYYFTIGRNWAGGHASTFDLIDRTNGYHPLWQLIATVPFVFGLDGLTAVRFLLVVQLVLWAGAMAVVAGAVARAVDDWSRLGDHPEAKRFCDLVVVTAFVVLWVNPFIFKMTVNGLESGVVVPVAAVLLATSVGFGGRFMSRATSRQRWMTGGLLALAFLARTDAVILCATVAAWCALDARGTTPRTVHRARAIAEIFAVPTIVITGYLVVNRIVFGTALQISGVVKRLPLTPARGLLAVIWAIVGLAVMAGARRPFRRSARLLYTRRFLASSGWYAAFCIGLVGYYATLQEVPYLWYFAPLALYGTFLLVLLVADLAAGGVLEATDASRPVTSLSVRAPAAILVVPLVAMLAWSIPPVSDPGTRSLMVHDAAAGRWIDANLPGDARIASWDAGAIGYFAHRKVVNLDGVVNSLAWYQAARDGRTAPFLADRNVTWAVNHGRDVDGRDPDITRQLRALFGPERAHTITVVHGDTYRYTGTLDGSRGDTSTKRMGTWVYRLTPAGDAVSN